MTAEPSLYFNANDRVALSAVLAVECSAWCINILGLTRQQAVDYLLKQVKFQSSDGEWCNYQDAFDYEGKCICARLLGLLHEVSEEEMDKEMFTRLMAFLEGIWDDELFIDFSATCEDCGYHKEFKYREPLP